VAVRVLTRDQNDSGLDFVTDLEHEPDRAAVVEQTHRLAVTEIAWARLVWVQDTAGRSLAPARGTTPRKTRCGSENSRVRSRDVEWPARR
jgi:hypothetical protein